MTSVRAVLFDLDGVLIHSHGVWFALIQQLCRDLGYPVVDAAGFQAMWGQGIQADVDTLFVRHTVADMSALYDRHFLDHADELAVDPAGPPLIAALRASGLPVAIVTNTPRPLADALLAHAGLEPDTLVGGTDCPRAKPAPDMVQEACRRLGVACDQALMVGDTAADAGAARSAGTPFCGFGGIRGNHTEASLDGVRRLVLG